MQRAGGRHGALAPLPRAVQQLAAAAAPKQSRLNRIQIEPEPHAREKHRIERRAQIITEPDHEAPTEASASSTAVHASG